MPKRNQPNPETGKPRQRRSSRDLLANINETRLVIDDIVSTAPTELVHDKAHVEQIFLTFAALSGDIFRSAAACGVTPEVITQLAEENKWLERIRALIELKKGDKGADVERGIGRAINFVHANRYRLVLEQILTFFEGMTPREIVDFCTSYRTTKDGSTVPTGVSFRLLADIATAMEKVHWMTYQALLDTPQDRLARREKAKDADVVEDDIHAKIAKTLAGMTDRTPAAIMDKVQDAQVTALTKDSQPPTGG